MNVLLFDADFSSLFHVIISLIYLIFIVYLMIDEIRLLVHHKWIYFRQLWAGVRMRVRVGIYVWRHREMSRIGDLFKKTNGDVHINLQFASLDILDGCPSSVMHCILPAKIWACSSLLQMLFEMILMKFDATDILSANALVGPMCVIVFVVFIGVTMFISIINYSFRIVRKNHRLDQNEDRHMLAFIWNRFQLRKGRLFLSLCHCFHWIHLLLGLKQLSEEDLHEERDKRIRSEYDDPIERFPDRIDQLFEGLNRVSVTRAMFVGTKPNRVSWIQIYLDQQMDASSRKSAGYHERTHRRPRRYQPPMTPENVF
jgi:hypothetical protein